MPVDSTHFKDDLADIEEDRRSEEMEQRKAAEVLAAIERRQERGGEQAYLVIRNAGPAVAKDVRFDPAELPENVHLLEKAPEIETLPRGSEVPIRLFVGNGAPRAVPLTIRWSDDTGPRDQVFPLSP